MRLLSIIGLGCAAALIAALPLEAQSPVADALRAATGRAARNLPAAADEMPADKFGFKPTAAQMTFGELVLHVAGSNARLCSWISGIQAPDLPALAPTDPKDKLLARLGETFTYCTSALAALDDSKLADSVPFFGGRKVTRAAAMLALAGDWADHYSQAAIYLRLNGLLPPTARRDGM
ncbi:MAG TPA: DinB family protein [Gemmatimonadales bacterium]|nr:DinB family protein [Gemmatimonadales bacterium]